MRECGCDCTDAGPAPDAGMCNPAEPVCADLNCFCCPIGGPGQAFICSESRAASSDCTDPARPLCNIDPFTELGLCTASDFFCCWGCDQRPPRRKVGQGDGGQRETRGGSVALGRGPESRAILSS